MKTPTQRPTPILVAATLSLLMAACSPAAETDDAAPNEEAPPAATAPTAEAEPAHADDDAAEPTAEDHSHEGPDAAHAPH
jgi:hypothetical protein